MAAVAALCVQYEADFRPNMSIVVKALQPLLNARHGPQTEAPHLWIHLFIYVEYMEYMFIVFEQQAT